MQTKINITHLKLKMKGKMAESVNIFYKGLRSIRNSLLERAVVRVMVRESVQERGTEKETAAGLVASSRSRGKGP